jgi:hypothetical protein
MKIYTVIRTSIYVSEFQVDLFTSLEDARKKFQEHREDIIPEDFEDEQLSEYGDDCFCFDCYYTGNIERVEILVEEVQK